MRHHLLLAFAGIIAAATSLTSAHSSHSSLEQGAAHSSLIKRTGNHNSGGGGYSYCAQSSDKLVFKNGQCSCKQNPGSQYTKCNGPKTSGVGRAVCGESGCNIICDDDEMVVSNGDCKCPSGFTLQNNKCIKTCGQYEAYDSRTRSCECAPSCGRNSRNSNRCEPSCGDNEEYKNGACACKSGFERPSSLGKRTGNHNNDNGNDNNASKKCVPICRGAHELVSGNSCKCEAGFKYDANKICKTICTGDNEEFKNGGCVCKAGFERSSSSLGKRTGNHNNINNNNKPCVPLCRGSHEVRSGNTCACEAGFKYNGDKQCKPLCEGDNEKWENGRCVCVPGCGRDGRNRCTLTCPNQNEELGNNNKCKCKDGFKRDKNGVCKPEIPDCPRYMEWNGHKCVCKPGCNPHGNTCNPPQCRTNEEYNEILKKCVCKDNFERTLWGFCLPSCPGKNTYWNGEKCVCKPGCWKHGNDDDCEPNTPSHRPVPDIKKSTRAIQDVPVWSSKFHTRDQDSLFCPDSLSACPIPSSLGGYECVDTTQELENCGGCSVDGDGVDCTTITGVEGVGCLSGQCVVFSCADGYRLSSNGACVASLLG